MTLTTLEYIEEIFVTYSLNGFSFISTLKKSRLPNKTIGISPLLLLILPLFFK